jgi:hypothetical protein
MSTAELTLAELDAYSSRDELIAETLRRAASELGIATPTWSSVARRGNANVAHHHVTLPEWAGVPGKTWEAGHGTSLYLAYYVVHECAHLPRDSYGHGPAFKQYERATLAAVLGVGIRYMRNYPAVLFDLETGAELFVSDRERRRRIRVVNRRAVRARMIELRERMPEAMDYELEPIAWQQVAAGQADR